MAITETLSPEAHQLVDESIASAHLGHVVLTEAAGEVNSPTRSIELSSGEYSTDLPEGINPFEDREVRVLDHESLLPSGLEQLPVGDFKISRDTTTVEGMPYKEERKIGVHQGNFGKVIDKESFSLENSERWHLEEGTDKLVTALGFELSINPEGSKKVSGIPSPEAVVAAAKENGVNIKLFPDQGYIDGKDYLGAFAEGKYPVSTKTEAQFRHDIEDDHLTAMVIGGEPLRLALSEVATKALTGNKDTIDSAASDVDAFTATLRGITAPHTEFLGYAYSEEAGRKTLHNVGQRLGIPTETINTIISTAHDSAKNLGMPVRELV